jgi:hypothetical protein
MPCERLHVSLDFTPIERVYDQASPTAKERFELYNPHNRLVSWLKAGERLIELNGHLQRSKLLGERLLPLCHSLRRGGLKYKVVRAIFGGMTTELLDKLQKFLPKTSVNNLDNLLDSSILLAVYDSLFSRYIQYSRSLYELVEPVISEVPISRRSCLIQLLIKRFKVRHDRAADTAYRITKSLKEVARQSEQFRKLIQELLAHEEQFFTLGLGRPVTRRPKENTVT